MQRVIYQCDNCKKEIGPKKHISLSLNQNYSGIANPPGKNGGGWRVVQLPRNFLHFCTGKCIGQYFGGLLLIKK